MAGEDFIYRGNLAETPLSEMLTTIHRHGVGGLMEFSSEEDTKRVYFHDGDVIFATSSDMGESLGDFLLKQGRISEAQYKVSSDELARSPGKRHGSILVQMGFLKPDELGAAVREQVQTILWNLFNWGDGEVTFSVGRFRDDEVYKIKIPTPRAVLSGCKRIADAKVVMSRLGSKSTVFRTAETPERLKNLRLDSGERTLLEMVNGRRSLYQLCEEGPLSPGINARVLYALMELQLVQRDLTATSGIRIQVRDAEPS